MRESKAIVLADYHQLPQLVDVTIADPGPNEVLVRIKASGICHTDIGYMRDARQVPVLLGHEGAGVVEQIGANVTHTRPGDHVAVNWQAKCYQCRWCLSDRTDLCEHVQSTAAPRVFWKEEPLAIMLNAGTFCEYAVLPAGGAVPVRKDIPFEKAALLGCGVATGVGAALYTARVAAGEGVVVIGAGGVGLNIIQGARLAGATPIIAVDIAEGSLQRADQFGASHLINSQKTEPLTAVREITAGRGVEHVFEVIGQPALMAKGIEMLSRGGALTLVGAAARDAELTFAPRRFMSQQQRVQGCIYGNVHPAKDLPLFADWYVDGRLELDALHTATISLADVPKVFAGEGPPSAVRTVVRFS